MDKNIPKNDGIKIDNNYIEIITQIYIINTPNFNIKEKREKNDSNLKKKLFLKYDNWLRNIIKN